MEYSHRQMEGGAQAFPDVGVKAHQEQPWLSWSALMRGLQGWLPLVFFPFNTACYYHFLSPSHLTPCNSSPNHRPVSPPVPILTLLTKAAPKNWGVSQSVSHITAQLGSPEQLMGTKTRSTQCGCHVKGAVLLCSTLCWLDPKISDFITWQQKRWEMKSPTASYTDVCSNRTGPGRTAGVK